MGDKRARVEGMEGEEEETAMGCRGQAAQPGSHAGGTAGSPPPGR